MTIKRAKYGSLYRREGVLGSIPDLNDDNKTYSQVGKSSIYSMEKQRSEATVEEPLRRESGAPRAGRGRGGDAVRAC